MKYDKHEEHNWTPPDITMMNTGPVNDGQNGETNIADEDYAKSTNEKENR